MLGWNLRPEFIFSFRLLLLLERYQFEISRQNYDHEKLTCCYCCRYCRSSSAKKRQDLVCWGKWGITYLVCMIYEIIGELTRLLLTLTIVFTMMRMKERKDEMEKHLWPNSLNSDNVTSSTADSILNQAYCKKWNGTLLSDRIVCTLYFLISKDIWQM